MILSTNSSSAPDIRKLAQEATYGEIVFIVQHASPREKDFTEIFSGCNG